jgi:hypothetical protein
MTCPSTSARNTAPIHQLGITKTGVESSPSLLIIRLTVSITSTNASFLRYLTSERLHEVAPVACIVIFDESSLCADQLVPPKSWFQKLTTANSDFMLSVVIYILSVSISEFWGYPKSRISTPSAMFVCRGI